MATANCAPVNPCYIGLRLSSLFANADCVCLAGNTAVKNVDIVTTSGEINASIGAENNIVRPGRVVLKCVLAVGCVVVSGGIKGEGSLPGGCVVVSRLDDLAIDLGPAGAPHRCSIAM